MQLDKTRKKGVIDIANKTILVIKCALVKNLHTYQFHTHWLEYRYEMFL